MIPLYDLMLQAQNGNAMDVMAKQFGLAQKQASEAVSALMPAFSEGLKRSATNPYDFGAFLKALYSGDYAKYFDDMTKAFTPKGIEQGNDLLGQFFGSKEVSRAIAAQAAQMTGIGQEIYKQMMPVVASTLMGGLFKQSVAPYFGATQQGMENPFVAAMQQWLQATGMAKKPEPDSSPLANPFNNPFTQAFFGTAGGKKEETNIFADNPFAKAFADMMTAMGGGKPETPQPEKADTPADSLTKFVNTMFDTGLEMQKDYQKSIEGIFDAMSKSAGSEGKAASASKAQDAPDTPTEPRPNKKK